MRNSRNVYAELSDPVPLLYTRDEVADHLLLLLVLAIAEKISDKELYQHFKAMRYDLKSMSNNTIQGSYFSRRIDIRVAHSRLRKLVEIVLGITQ